MRALGQFPTANVKSRLHPGHGLRGRLSILLSWKKKKKKKRKGENNNKGNYESFGLVPYCDTMHVRTRLHPAHGRRGRLSILLSWKKKKEKKKEKGR